MVQAVISKEYIIPEKQVCLLNWIYKNKMKYSNNNNNLNNSNNHNKNNIYNSKKSP